MKEIIIMGGGMKEIIIRGGGKTWFQVTLYFSSSISSVLFWTGKQDVSRRQAACKTKSHKISSDWTVTEIKRYLWWSHSRGEAQKWQVHSRPTAHESSTQPHGDQPQSVHYVQSKHTPKSQYHTVQKQMNHRIPQTARIIQVCSDDDDDDGDGIRVNKQEEQEKSGEQPCHYGPLREASQQWGSRTWEEAVKIKQHPQTELETRHTS